MNIVKMQQNWQVFLAFTRVSIAIFTFRSVKGSWKRASNTLDLREKIILEVYFKKM